jgi:hypothetical protein
LRAKAAGIRVSIECTYTERHARLGLSVVDLMRFFREEFGERHTHIAPACSSPVSADTSDLRQVISNYCEAIAFMVASRGTEDYMAINLGQELLDALCEREGAQYYCPAGMLS